MTSAPWSAKNRAQAGTAMKVLSSTTLTPVNVRLIALTPFLFRIDAFTIAEKAGKRKAHLRAAQSASLIIRSARPPEKSRCRTPDVTIF